ncbi:MAG: PE-PPE domain-containing protein, partial [Mycobacterium sp.]
MRRATRPYITTGIAIVVGAGLMVVPPAAPPAHDIHAAAIRLTSSDAADSALGDGTALIMGPSTLPIPPQGYLDAIDALYLQSRGFTDTPQALFT